MKKKYVKPELFFESFEMNTAIASCAGKIVNAQYGGNDCRVETSIGVIFVTSPCDWSTQDDDWRTLCYDIPSPDQKLFYS